MTALERGDLLLAGVLLAELATGQRPALNSYAADGSTLRDPRPLDPLPRPLARFILRCTDARPAVRPADSGAVLEEFERLVGSVAL